MVRPLSYFDLIESFPKPGCAVCRLLLRDAEHVLDSLLYERVNEPDSHRLFRAARGLCNEHAWQLLNYHGGAVGIAILYRATVDEVLKILNGSSQDAFAASGLSWLRSASVNAAGLAEHLTPTTGCMVCKLLSKAEQDYFKSFSSYASEADLQTAYASSQGFCLPHFRLVLEQSYPPDLLRKIIDIQKTIWESLRTDLEEFVDKNRHERMQEAMGGESDSWLRAIEHMAGAKGVFGVQARPVK